MSKTTPNDGSLQTTKQMLDELDALMDRMLSLPVNEGEDAAPLPEKSPVLSAKLTLLESVSPMARPMPAPSQQVPLPSDLEMETSPYNPPHFAQHTPPAFDPMAFPYADVPPQPQLQPEPLTNEVTPPSVLPKLEPLLSESAGETAPVGTQLGYLPLVWINEGFDHLVAALPGIGALLCSAGGRALLGLSGLALTVLSAAWLVKDWLGWN